MDSDTEIEARLEELKAQQSGTPAPAAEPVEQKVETEAKPVAKTEEKKPITPAVKEPFPGYSKLSEEDRKLADKWWAEQKSVIGKVPHAQRENESLRRERDQLKQEMAKLSKTMTPQQKTEMAKWEKLKELAPEDVEAYEERLSPLVAEIAELKKQLTELPKAYEERFSRFEQREHLAEITEKRNSVMAEHPDYMDVVQTVEVEELDNRGRPTGRILVQFDEEAPFTQWLRENPEFIPAMSGTDPKGHSRVLKYYKLENGLQTAVPEKEIDPRAAAVAKRTNTLKQAPDPKSSGAAVRAQQSQGSDAEIDARLAELDKLRNKR